MVLEFKIPTYEEQEKLFNEKYKFKTFYYSYDEERAFRGCGLSLLLDKILCKELNEKDIDKLLRVIGSNYDIRLINENDNPSIRSNLEKYFLKLDIYKQDVKFSVTKFNNYIQDIFKLAFKAYEYKNSNGDKYWVIYKLY